MTISMNPDAAVSTLRQHFDGRVIVPGDDGYDAARTVFAGDVDRRPSVIVCPTDAAGVARVIATARESGLELAVRSGGHSNVGHGVVDDGIVLDLSAMNAVEIDPGSRTAWAQSGATASRYTAAAAKHGLATGFGDTGTVGLGGITLGGGVGFLSRAYGLTIDELLAAEVVTADGQVVHTDEHSHPDLFWAIRGGGGNFGVATRFKYRLRQVDTVVGGMLLLPATPATIAGFMAEAEAAPDGLSTIANVMPVPPMPFVPEEHHGRLAIMALLCHTGPVEAGERAVAPFRAQAQPIADLVKPMPYPEIFGPDQSDYRPTAVARNLFADAVDEKLAEAILERLEASDAPMRAVQLRALGGAIARVPAEATAYAHRSRRLMVNVAAFYTGPDDRPEREAWVSDVVSILRQGDDHAYVNFLADEGPERVRAAYPGDTWRRLTEVKKRYDPTNLFHHNQNIPPA